MVLWTNSFNVELPSMTDGDRSFTVHRHHFALDPEPKMARVRKRLFDLLLEKLGGCIATNSLDMLVTLKHLEKQTVALKLYDSNRQEPKEGSKPTESSVPETPLNEPMGQGTKGDKGFPKDAESAGGRPRCNCLAFISDWERESENSEFSFDPRIVITYLWDLLVLLINEWMREAV